MKQPAGSRRLFFLSRCGLFFGYALVEGLDDLCDEGVADYVFVGEAYDAYALDALDEVDALEQAAVGLVGKVHLGGVSGDDESGSSA